MLAMGPAPAALPCRPRRLRLRLGPFLAAVVAALVTGVLGVTPPAHADAVVDEVHYSFTSETSVAIDSRAPRTICAAARRRPTATPSEPEPGAAVFE